MYISPRDGRDPTAPTSRPARARRVGRARRYALSTGLSTDEDDGRPGPGRFELEAAERASRRLKTLRGGRPRRGERRSLHWPPSCSWHVHGPGLAVGRYPMHCSPRTCYMPDRGAAIEFGTRPPGCCRRAGVRARTRGSDDQCGGTSDALGYVSGRRVLVTGVIVGGFRIGRRNVTSPSVRRTARPGAVLPISSRVQSRPGAQRRAARSVAKIARAVGGETASSESCR